MEAAPPEARSYLLDDLAPGLVEYYVTTIYPRGFHRSGRAPCRSLSCPKPATSSSPLRPTSTAGSAGPGPTARTCPRAVRSVSKSSTSTRNRPGDHFRNYGRFRNHQQQTPSQPSFIAYGLKPDVTYDFRIVAVDAAGRKNESNVASATVVYDADATSDANSPRNLRVQPDNNSGALVTWSAPASLAAGRTLSGYVLQWLSGGVNSTTVAAGTTSHRITGLTDGTVYKVRVAARTSRPRIRPVMTPGRRSRRRSRHGRSRRRSGSLTRRLTYSSVRSPLKQRPTRAGRPPLASVQITLRTIISSTAPSEVGCQHAPTGGITSEVDWRSLPPRPSVTSQTSASVSGQPPAGRQDSRPPYPSGADASDNDRRPPTRAKIAIAWDGPQYRTGVSGTLRYYVGRQLRYGRKHRHLGPCHWERQLPYLSRGWQMGRTGLPSWGPLSPVGDHDGDPTTDPHEDIETDGFTAGLLYGHRGRGQHRRAGPGDRRHGHARSRFIDRGVGAAGRQSLGGRTPTRCGIATTSLPATAPTTWDGPKGPVLLPRQTLRICDPTGCENPRSYEITGLIGGNRYDVAVRAQSANGWGAWHYIGIRNVADGFTPVLQSAAVNAASLTLTFDRTIDTDSKPDKSAFNRSMWPGPTRRPQRSASPAAP